MPSIRIGLGLSSSQLILGGSIPPVIDGSILSEDGLFYLVSEDGLYYLEQE